MPRNWYVRIHTVAFCSQHGHSPFTTIAWSTIHGCFCLRVDGIAFVYRWNENQEERRRTFNISDLLHVSITVKSKSHTGNYPENYAWRSHSAKTHWTESCDKVLGREYSAKRFSYNLYRTLHVLVMKLNLTSAFPSAQMLEPLYLHWTVTSKIVSDVAFPGRDDISFTLSIVLQI